MTARSKLLSRTRDVSLSPGYRKGRPSELGGHRTLLAAARTPSEQQWGYLLVEAVPLVGEGSFPSHLASVPGQGQDRAEDSSH